MSGLSTKELRAIHIGRLNEGFSHLHEAQLELSDIFATAARYAHISSGDGQLYRISAVKYATLAGFVEQARELVRVFSTELGASDELKADLQKALLEKP